MTKSLEERLHGLGDKEKGEMLTLLVSLFKRRNDDSDKIIKEITSQLDKIVKLVKSIK